MEVGMLESTNFPVVSHAHHKHWRVPVQIGQHTILASSLYGVPKGDKGWQTDLANKNGISIYLSMNWLYQFDSKVVLSGNKYDRILVDWPDYGVISLSDANLLVDLIIRKLKGHCPVEIACHGGHGRTGTLLALVAKRLGIRNPVQLVRLSYCSKAVEGDKQEELIRRFK